MNIYELFIVKRVIFFKNLVKFLWLIMLRRDRYLILDRFGINDNVEIICLGKGYYSVDRFYLKRFWLVFVVIMRLVVNYNWVRFF